MKQHSTILTDFRQYLAGIDERLRRENAIPQEFDRNLRPSSFIMELALHFLALRITEDTNGKEEKKD